ncbi:MAG: hypothetical protein WBW67_16810, partial [Pseudolabrys sp.]
YWVVWRIRLGRLLVSNPIGTPQLISVSTTHPVDVLVLIKLSCCPRVTAKYSGELVGNHVVEL